MIKMKCREGAIKAEAAPLIILSRPPHFALGGGWLAATGRAISRCQESTFNDAIE